MILSILNEIACLSLEDSGNNKTHLEAIFIALIGTTFIHNEVILYLILYRRLQGH